jgi:hypothetical protein
VPATVWGNELVGLHRSPGAGLVGVRSVVGHEDGIYDLPGSLDRVLPGEEPAVTGHGIAEQPLVGRILVWLGVE